MFKVLCSNYKGLTYERKINVNRGGGLVFASSFPMIAASCENKNPTDESIINNTTPQTQGNQNQENPSGSDNSSPDVAPQTQGNQNQENPSGSDSSSSNTTTQTQDNQKQENKSKEEKPNGSDSSSSNTTPQTQGNQSQENPSGSGNSSPDTTHTIPQTQSNQKQENKSKEEKQKEDLKDLLKQIEEIKKEYEKAKERKKELLEKSIHFSDLAFWFERITDDDKTYVNYYTEFKSNVEKNKIDSFKYKYVKDFIKRYKTEIKEDLKKQEILE